MPNHTCIYQNWSRRGPVIKSFGENIVHLAQNLSRTRREINTSSIANNMLFGFIDRNVFQGPGASLENKLTLIVKALLLDFVCPEESGVWVSNGIGWAVEDVWYRRSKILSTLDFYR